MKEWVLECMYDIVYVTYNSAKWVNKCLNSLLMSGKANELNVFLVDNHSTDNTLEVLEQFKSKEKNRFASFNIVKEEKNLGFGKANNIGFAQGKSDIVCFFNIDTEVFDDTFEKLDLEVRKSEHSVGVWELRQFPYEHPKMYDVLTGETSWVSGAAFAVRRNVFAEVNGFDEKIFMYAEDVDLSWRIRAHGYMLKYVPKVKITHYSYKSAGELKPNQHVNSVINNLLLRYRYGGISTIISGHVHFWSVLSKSGAFPGAKKQLLRKYISHFGLIGHFYSFGKYKKNGVGNFIGWDYSAIRDGAFHQLKLPIERPLVSIIVRTCGRPDVLRESLISLRGQTYDNIEIVIVEDGENISEKMIRNEFSDMNILYKATGVKVGRSKAGNLAMSIAHGRYLNFLDDDDLFYADHVEVLVEALLDGDNLAAYATAFETPIVVKTMSPYSYEVKDYIGRHKQAFDKIVLCHHNYIPIQCIMFSKELFDKYGGLDETVEALEDWDMWVRFSLHTDFTYVFKTTSIYRVPAVYGINKERQDALDEALIGMREKHKNYMQSVSVYDLCQLYEHTI